jgi:hypothetical protein
MPAIRADGPPVTSGDDGRRHRQIAETFEAFQNGTLENVPAFALLPLRKKSQADYILTPDVWRLAERGDGEPLRRNGRLTGELSEHFCKSYKLEAEIKRSGAIGYEV